VTVTTGRVKIERGLKPHDYMLDRKFSTSLVASTPALDRKHVEAFEIPIEDSGRVLEAKPA
jgi:hypothetical protein